MTKSGYTIEELNKLIKELKDINNTEDYQLISNIILIDIKKGESSENAIAETNRGTFFNFTLLSKKVILELQNYLKIKKRNDYIEKLKNKNN